MGTLMGLAGAALAAGVGGGAPPDPAREVVTIVSKWLPGRAAADLHRAATLRGTVPLGRAEPAAVRRPVW